MFIQFEINQFELYNQANITIVELEGLCFLQYQFK